MACWLLALSFAHFVEHVVKRTVMKILVGVKTLHCTLITSNRAFHANV